MSYACSAQPLMGKMSRSEQRTKQTTGMVVAWETRPSEFAGLNIVVPLNNLVYRQPTFPFNKSDVDLRL